MSHEKIKKPCHKKSNCVFLWLRWKKLEVAAFVIFPSSIMVLFGIHQRLKVHFLNELRVFFKQFIHEEISFIGNCRHSRLKMFFKICVLKGYLHYKTATSQNVSSEAQVKSFLFRRKIMFRSQDIQVFVFLSIPWFTKSVTSLWVLVYETWSIFAYMV